MIGNERLRLSLESMVERGRVGNSLLFAGPEGVGKSFFAKFLSQKILGCDEAEKHPDFHLIRTEGKLSLHTIDAMRWLSKEVHMPPYYGKNKVFVLEDAHKMRPESANALLKTFEEPSLDTVIILVTHNLESILPTILSRCRIINFQPVGLDEIVAFIKSKYNKNEIEANSIAMRSAGSVARAIRIAEGEEEERRQLLLQFLPNGKVRDYQELKSFIKSIAGFAEKNKKEEEEKLREELIKDDMTAVQKAAIEKELQGAVSSRFLSFADSLFDDIISWYRDLQLLRLGGNKQYLFYGDKKNLLDKGKALSLEDVQSTINQAQLALRRASKFEHCLENLFLKLNFL